MQCDVFVFLKTSQDGVERAVVEGQEGVEVAVVEGQEGVEGAVVEGQECEEGAKNVKKGPRRCRSGRSRGLKREKVRKLKEFVFLLQHTYLDIKPFIVKCFSK